MKHINQLCIKQEFYINFLFYRISLLCL